MSPRAWVAALTVVLVVVLGACGGSSSTDKPAPSPAPGTSAAGTSTTGATAEESPSDPALTGAPAVGTCWRLPPVRIAAQDDWFDDSPQVPCTQRHTVQTVAVYPLDRPTPKQAQAHADACVEDARLFIGVDVNNWVPWEPFLFLPSRDRVAGGASWVRCDVAFVAMSSGVRPAWFTGSAEEMVLRHPEKVWGCLDVFPQPAHPRRFVPCDKPHAYEATGHVLFLEGLHSYPTPRRLHAKAADCRVAYRNPVYQGLAMRALWPPPDEMPGGDTLIGSCWVHRPDGKDLPPLQ